jgi:hypothetical protein
MAVQNLQVVVQKMQGKPSFSFERYVSNRRPMSAEIAGNHVQTVQVCIDRLYQLGANEQLKLLTERLQKLAVRATPVGDEKGTKAGTRRPSTSW